MSLAEDLLQQASDLAERERGKPRQASLRRAVSTAYYALFHLLADHGAGVVAGGRKRLRAQVQRAFAHAHMKEVCNRFAKESKLTPEYKSLVQLPLEPEIQAIAAAFVELQEARHTADYDVSEPYSRADVRDSLKLAEQSFDSWARVKANDNARVFLIALLLHRHWRR